MSWSKDDIEKIVCAIKKGATKYNDEEISGSITKELDSGLFQFFFSKIVEAIEDEESVYKIRKALGPYYGSKTIADLGFYKTWDIYDKSKNILREKGGLLGKDSRVPYNFKKRMQVVVAEAIKWLSGNPIVAELVLASSLLRSSPREKIAHHCIAFHQTKSMSPYLEVQEKFHSVLDNYVNNVGSSVLHHAYILQDPIMSISPSYIKDNRDSPRDGNWTNPPGGQFAPEQYFIGSCHDKMFKARKPFREDKYIAEVIEEVFGLPVPQDNSYVQVCFFSGSDTRYDNQEINVGSAACMYLILKSERISRQYLRAMQHLVQSLPSLLSLEIQREQEERIRLQARRLDLIQEPLQQLTEALKTTDASAQHIRTALYDSYGSFSGIAHRVSHYFDDGHWQSEAGFSWKVVHDIEKDTAGWEVGFIILGIVLRIFGEDITNIKNAKELWCRASNYIYSDDEATKSLRNMLEVILFTRSDISKQDKQAEQDNKQAEQDKLWQSLGSKADAIVKGRKFDSVNDKVSAEYHRHWCNVANRFKAILHTPYKPYGNAATLLPLAFVLYQEQMIAEEPSGPVLTIIKPCESHKTMDDVENISECVRYETKEFNTLEGVLKVKRMTYTKLFSVYEMPFSQDRVFWAFIFRLSKIKKLERVTARQFPKDERGTFLTIRFQDSLYSTNTLNTFRSILKGAATIINGGDSLDSASGAPGGNETNAWYQFARCCRTSTMENKWYASSREVDGKIVLDLQFPKEASKTVFSITASASGKELQFCIEDYQAREGQGSAG